MKTLLKITGIVLLFVLPLAYASASPATPERAQVADTGTCPDIVARAWESLDTACLDGVRNTACYGHILLDAEPQDYVANFQFEVVGDRANVADLRSLQLSTMDLDTGSWGVAMLTLQANLPAAAPDQNVALLMFGDVQIDNAADNMPTLEVYTGAANANIRAQPDAAASVLGTIPANNMAVATGRLADGSWVRVQIPDGTGTGWVYAPVIRTANGADLNTLAAVTPYEPYYGPMQAFYFESAADDAACAEAPNSGILIQTPEGVAEVTLLINEVDISLGSTVFFQAQAGGELRVSVVEGHANVYANGVLSVALPGTQVRVPLDETGAAAGSPSLPEPFNLDNLQSLPLDHLPRAVEMGDPMTQAEIDIYVAALAGGGDGGNNGAEKVLVCHNGQTIEIAITALDAHLAQGDTQGPCPGDPVVPVLPVVPGEPGEPGDQACEKIVICHKGKTTLEICIEAWPAFEAQGATQGPCE